MRFIICDKITSAMQNQHAITASQLQAIECKNACTIFLETYPTLFALYRHCNHSDYSDHFLGFYTDISQIPTHFTSMNANGNPFCLDGEVEWKTFVTVIRTDTLTVSDLSTLLHRYPSMLPAKMRSSKYNPQR